MALSYLSACSVSGAEAPPSNQAQWDVSGIWTKIEGGQKNNATYFPNPYNPNASGQANSTFGKLDRWTWYKGIHYPIDWADIETSQGVYNWTETDFILNTIASLPKATGQGKKVMFLIAWKAFNEASVANILPAYLRNPQPPAYSNGHQKWHRTIGWTSGMTPVGYHLRLQDFRNGLTGNDRAGAPIYTLRDRYYAFLQALNDRYQDHPAFRGLVTLETTPQNVNNEMWDATEYNRDQWFAGRLALLKKMKQIFQKQLVAEAASEDAAWRNAMTLGTATDGMITNGIAFTAPNFHTGAQQLMDCVYNAADFLAGKVPILNSCQPFDCDSKRGQTIRAGVNNDVYNFAATPPNYGSPRTMIENENVALNPDGTKRIIAHDPPEYTWILHRAIYLKSNIIVIQNNYASIGANGAPRYNFDDFATDMNANTTMLSPNTGGLIQDDPAGGMVTARPLKVAGD